MEIVKADTITWIIIIIIVLIIGNWLINKMFRKGGLITDRWHHIGD